VKIRKGKPMKERFHFNPKELQGENSDSLITGTLGFLISIPLSMRG